MRSIKLDTVRKLLLLTAVAVTAAQPLVAQTRQPVPPPINPHQLHQRIMTGLNQGLSDLFDRVDANRDGRVTPAEATAFARLTGQQLPVGSSWTLVDTNRDGAISKQELLSAASNQMNLGRLGR